MISQKVAVLFVFLNEDSDEEELGEVEPVMKIGDRREMGVRG